MCIDVDIAELGERVESVHESAERSPGVSEVTGHLGSVGLQVTADERLP
jgi:hypothetical protein